MEDSTILFGLSLFLVSTGDSLGDQSGSSVLNFLDQLLHSLLLGEYFLASGLYLSDSFLYLIDSLNGCSAAVNSLSTHHEDLLNACLVILRYIVVPAVVTVGVHCGVVVAEVLLLLVTELFGSNKLLL